MDNPNWAPHSPLGHPFDEESILHHEMCSPPVQQVSFSSLSLSCTPLAPLSPLHEQHYTITSSLTPTNPTYPSVACPPQAESGENGGSDEESVIDTSKEASEKSIQRLNAQPTPPDADTHVEASQHQSNQQTYLTQADSHPSSAASGSSPVRIRRSARRRMESERPVDAKVIRLPGEGDHCGYHAIGRALGGFTLQQVHTLLSCTLDSIEDAPTLVSYSIMEDPLAGPAEVTLAKEKFKKQKRFAELRNAGDAEFYLASHAMGGDLSFLFVSPDEDGFTKKGFFPRAQSVCCVDPDSDIPPTRKEVALHWCSYTGQSSSLIQLPNHYDYINYVMPDGRVEPYRNMSVKESKRQYMDRIDLLVRVAHASTRMKQLERTLPYPDRFCREKRTIGLGRDSEKEYSNQRRGPLQPAMITSTTVPPANPHLRTYQHRPRIWHVIPRVCENDFLAVVSPYFEEYRRLHQMGEDGFHSCEELLETILDLPRRCLIRGRVASLRSLRQTLASHSLHTFVNGKDVLVQSGNDRTLTDKSGKTNSNNNNNNINFPTPPDTTGHQCAESGANVHVENRHAKGASDPNSVDHDDAPDADVQAIRRAVSIVREGAPRNLSRATKALLQSPSVPINSDIIDQLRALHPAPVRSEPFSELPEGHAIPIVSIEEELLFQLLKSRVDNGSSPGPSGWSGSHLQLIATRGSKHTRTGLCLLIQDICNGRFRGAVRERLLSCTLAPIWKRGVNNGIRPIAMGEVMYKLAAHYCMAQVEDHLPTLFPRIQFGVKRAGGSEAAAQLIRATLEEARVRDSTSIALATDFKNAFNLMSRVAAWEKLLSTPETEAIWRMFRWAYSVSSPLLVFDREELHTVLRSAEGTRQGDPFSAFIFALCMQQMYETAIHSLPNCHGIAVLDDFTLIGPATDVFHAFDRLCESAPSYNMQLQVAKCKVLYDSTMMNESTRALIHTGCAERHLEATTKMEALGVMHGSDETVTEHARETMESHALLFARIAHPAMPVQVGYQLLRFCAQPRLSFLARTVRPDLLEEAATAFDAMMMRCFMRLTHIDERAKSSLEPTLPRDSVDVRISLPIRMGGVGLRPVTRYHHSAYFSSLAASLPSICAAFPDLDVEATSISSQLEECREEMKKCMDVSDEEKTIHDIHTSVLGAAMKNFSSEGEKDKLNDKLNSSSNMQSETRHTRDRKRHPLPFTGGVESARTNRRREESARVGQLLRMPLHTLWQQAQEASTTSPAAADRFLRDISLQQHLTTRAELQLYESHLRSLSPYHQVTHTAIVLNQGVSEWMTVLPTEPAYQLTNEQFCLALRHRLGLLPFDSLAGKHCTNGCCLTRIGKDLHSRGISQRVKFTQDPDHFHSCAAHRRTHLTVRHNNLVQLLMQLARSVGFYASHEPNHHQRPAALHVELASTPLPNDMADESEEPLPTGWNDHADILLVKHDCKLYVDVAVTRPTARSRLEKASELRGVLTTPLYACRKFMERKHAKYDAIAQLNGYEMIPFIVESYGGLSLDARQLLSRLASHSTQVSESEWLRHALRSLSVALQAGNAFVAQAGMQQQLTSQHRNSLVQQSQKRYESQGRRKLAASTHPRVPHTPSLQHTGTHLPSLLPSQSPPTQPDVSEFPSKSTPSPLPPLIQPEAHVTPHSLPDILIPHSSLSIRRVQGADSTSHAGKTGMKTKKSHASGVQEVRADMEQIRSELMSSEQSSQVKEKLTLHPIPSLMHTHTASATLTLPHTPLSSPLLLRSRRTQLLAAACTAASSSLSIALL
jgi:Reverse transcriptase (RNA-dependent DNA polymerase)